MNIITHIILLILTLSTMNAQNINGKWILKDFDDIGTKSYPWPQYLVIEGDKVDLFIDNQGPYKRLQYTLVKNQLFYKKKVIHAEIEIDDDMNLFLFTDGLRNNKPTIVKWHYVKLVPTIVKIEETEFNQYKYKVYQEFDHPNLMPLDIILTPENSDFKLEGDTYFIHMDTQGPTNLKFPLKEITTDYILIYGVFFVEEEFVKGVRVE